MLGKELLEESANGLKEPCCLKNGVVQPKFVILVGLALSLVDMDYAFFTQDSTV